MLSDRTLRRLAWSLVGIYILLIAAGLILQGLSRAFYAQIEPYVIISLLFLVCVWMITGALIIMRHPQHPVGWLLCAGFFTSAFDMLSAGILAYDTNVSPGSLPGVNLALIWLKLENLGSLGLVSLTLLVLLFPDGRFFTPGWRKLAWTTVVTLLLFLPIQALEPGPADAAFLPERVNPFGVSASLWAYLKPLLWAGYAILVLCYWAAFASLLVRLRNARGHVRQQVKWLLLPVGLYGIGLIPFFIGAVEADVALLDFALALLQLALAGIVIAVAFAIFRYRLYDIDLIIRRTLVYTVLTTTLVVFYLGLVIALESALRLLVGSSGQVVTVVSTLTIAALFTPLRRRVQEVIDRRFYRQKYNAEQALAGFADAARNETDLEALTAQVVGIVQETMQPELVSLWLREGGEGRSGASNLSSPVSRSTA